MHTWEKTDQEVPNVFEENNQQIQMEPKILEKTELYSTLSRHYCT